MKQNFFNMVYPFTTENIAGYFPLLNLKNKTVLTTGSSLDQAFNALLLGAKEVCVIDINENTKKYYNKKRDLILTKNKDDFIKAIFQIKNISFVTWASPVEEIIWRNIYLETNDYYQTLRQKLEENEITFINGNIYHVDKYLNNETFDRIIFSNILQYIDFFNQINDQNEKLEILKQTFNSWYKHLNANGIFQLMYYYNYNKKSYDLNRIIDINTLNKFLNNKFELKTFPSTYDEHLKEDAIVTYTKSR